MLLPDSWHTAAIDPPELRDRCEGGQMEGLALLKLRRARFLARMARLERRRRRYERRHHQGRFGAAGFAARNALSDNATIANFQGRL